MKMKKQLTGVKITGFEVKSNVLLLTMLFVVFPFHQEKEKQEDEAE